MPADEHLGDDDGQPPAVIFDLDETLIDNAEFHARLVAEGREPDREAWMAWNREARARAVPGAREFVRWLDQRGVRVYYVSNRPADERAATRRQLEVLGFPVDRDGGNLLLRDDAAGFGRDKGSRRQLVDRTHRVIALFGDNLGDFIGGVLAERATRPSRIAPYQSWWGERWYVLPNPMYGSWIEAITAECPHGDSPDGRRACLDAAAGRD
jgi:acid phosphatase